MESIIIILILVTIMLILAIVLNMNIKKIKSIAENEKLDELTKQFPENLDICKYMLKKLKNETVKIEETKEGKTNLYIAISNKIIIANIKDTYTRIQTIAHECLHSIQNRKLLLFHFIYSNLYIGYFIIVIVLKIFHIIQKDMLQIAILSILGGVYYFIRSYLETDVMIKARYLAKEYIEENRLCTELEKEELIVQYDKINKCGIPLSNLFLLFHTYLKIILYCTIAIVL